MKNDIKNVLYMGVAFAAFLILLSNISISGNWNKLVSNMIYLFGWFLLTGISFILLYMNKSASMSVSILMCGVAGIGISGMIGELYNNGIYFDSVIDSTNTLSDIQTIIILIWLILGIVIGVIRNE
jgi:hypothetical protein